MNNKLLLNYNMNGTNRREKGRESTGGEKESFKKLKVCDAIVGENFVSTILLIQLYFFCLCPHRGFELVFQFAVCSVYNVS